MVYTNTMMIDLQHQALIASRRGEPDFSDLLQGFVEFVLPEKVEAIDVELFDPDY